MNLGPQQLGHHVADSGWASGEKDVFADSRTRVRNSLTSGCIVGEEEQPQGGAVICCTCGLPVKSSTSVGINL